MDTFQRLVLGALATIIRLQVSQWRSTQGLRPEYSRTNTALEQATRLEEHARP